MTLHCKVAQNRLMGLLPMCLLLAGLLLPSQLVRSDPPIRALLLTSPGVYHNYQYQTRVMTQGIARHANVRFDISVAQLERWKSTDYAADYDVLIYNICMADNTDAALIQNIRRQTEALGTPALVIHCSMHSFRETDLWWPLYGLKTVAHEHLRPLPQQHHGEHPILTGIPTDWTPTEDELYINIAFDAEPLLMSAGEDGKGHTTTWLKQQGDTLVFGTTLGHSDSTLEDPAFTRLLANAILYLTDSMDATGKPKTGVTPSGDPAKSIDSIDAPDGVKFLGEEGQTCVMRQFAKAVGPCYLGCILHPLKWGEEAVACKKSCEGKLPSSDGVIARCTPAED
ncbi:MAG: type 1 glutamine amidotransferase [Bacteroidia bacterium]|jgi:type 1 glutamine amidotransferase